jgi:hypothetical protein
MRSVTGTDRLVGRVVISRRPRAAWHALVTGSRGGLAGCGASLVCGEPQESVTNRVTARDGSVPNAFQRSTKTENQDSSSRHIQWFGRRSSHHQFVTCRSTSPADRSSRQNGGSNQPLEFLIFSSSRVLRYVASTATAIPMPPLTQSVARPRRRRCRFSAYTSVTRMRVPVQPMGCPRAIAPP